MSAIATTFEFLQRQKATAYRRAMMALGPAAYWPMDDPAGSTVARDFSGHGYDATVEGGVTLSADGPFPASVAATLDGTTGYFNAGRLTNLIATSWTSNLAFATIFRSTQTSEFGLAGINFGGNYGPWLYFSMNTDGAGRCSACWDYSGGNDTPGKKRLTAYSQATGALDGLWHLLIVNLDAGNKNITIDVDGISMSLTYYYQDAQPDYEHALRDDFLLGGITQTETPGLFMDGAMAHSALWTRTLAAAERSNLYSLAAALGLNQAA